MRAATLADAELSTVPVTALSAQRARVVCPRIVLDWTRHHPLSTASDTDRQRTEYVSVSTGAYVSDGEELTARPLT